jgi:hypothetical protein
MSNSAGFDSSHVDKGDDLLTFQSHNRDEYGST